MAQKDQKDWEEVNRQQGGRPHLRAARRWVQRMGRENEKWAGVTQDLEAHKKIPVLREQEIKTYLGDRDTNFPEFFIVERCFIRARDQSLDVAAALPYAYFWMRDLNKAFHFRSLPSEVTVDVRYMRAGFFVREQVGEEDMDPEETEQIEELPKKKIPEGEKEEPAAVPLQVQRPDFSQLETYDGEDYYSIHCQHQGMMRELLAAVPSGVHIIAPGDGYGLVAGLWPGSGTYGDLKIHARTHEKVRCELVEETVERGVQEAGDRQVLMICSYVAIFFSCAYPTIPTLWIDHPNIVDMVPGLIRLSEALFASPGLQMWVQVPLDREGRRRWAPYHVPYTIELSKQETLVIPDLSQIAQEYLRTAQTKKVVIPSFLEQYVRASGVAYAVVEEDDQIGTRDCPMLVTSFGAMVGRGECYVAQLGRVLNIENSQRFIARKMTLCSRTIYWVPREYVHYVPSRVMHEYIGDQIYFALPDEHQQRARVRYRVGDSFSELEYAVRSHNDRNVGGEDDLLYGLDEFATPQQIQEVFEDAFVPVPPDLREHVNRRHKQVKGVTIY